MNLGTLIVTLGADTSGLMKARTAMIRFQKDTVSSLDTMAQKLRTFGYLATTQLTVPIVAAGKTMIETAKDFEFAIQKMVGLADVAQNVANSWGKSVLEMSKLTGRKPKELAEGLYFIASSGIKGAKALDVLRASAMAAASGMGETQEIAQVLTSAMNAYANTGKSATYFTDVLVAGVREGKAEASDFARSLGAVIPVASNLGVTFDQVVGAMAAMTLTGSSAANASNYLRATFNTLLTANKQGAPVLKAMGLSYEQLRQILKKPDGLVEVMQKLANIQGEFGDEALRDVIPNIRALTAQMSLTGRNAKYNSEMMNRITNSAGSLGKAFAAIADTIKQRYDQALSSANVSLISLGKSIAESFLPILEKWVKKLDGLTESFNKLTAAQKETRIEIAKWTVLIGPIVLLSSLAIYTFTGLARITKTLASVFIYLSIATKGLATSFKFESLRALMTMAPGLTRVLFSLGGAIAGVAKWLTPIGASAVGVAAGAGLLAKTLIGLKKRTEEAAIKNNSFNTTLVEISGNLKKMKDLSEIDFSTASVEELTKVLNQAQKGYAEAINNIRNAAKLAGVTVDELFAGKGKARKWQGFVEMQSQAAKGFLDIANAANVALVASGKAYEEQMKALKESEESRRKAVQAEDIKKINDAFDDLAQGERYIARMTELFGVEFDATSEKIQLYNKVLSTLAGTTLPLTDKRLVELKKKLEDVRMTVPLQTVKMPEFPGLDKLHAEIQALDQAWKDMGADMNGAYDIFYRNVKNSYQKQLEALASEHDVGLISERDYLRRRHALIMASTKAGSRERLREMRAYSNELRQLNVQDAQLYLESAATAVQTFSNMLQAAKERELKMAGKSAKKREEIERAYFKREKALAIAEAVINGALAVTNILARVPAGPLNPASWVAIGITNAATAAQIGIIAAQRMKKGGIVPPGYPNDSYPALLSSGETVLPPKSLQNIFEVNPFMGKVEFVISDDVLIGFLEKAYTKKKLY